MYTQTFRPFACATLRICKTLVTPSFRIWCDALPPAHAFYDRITDFRVGVPICILNLLVAEPTRLRWNGKGHCRSRRGYLGNLEAGVTPIPPLGIWRRIVGESHSIGRSKQILAITAIAITLQVEAIICPAPASIRNVGSASFVQGCCFPVHPHAKLRARHLAENVSRPVFLSVFYDEILIGIL